MAGSTLADLIRAGTAAARPAASSVGVGALYLTTDTGITYRSTGSAWVEAAITTAIVTAAIATHAALPPGLATDSEVYTGGNFSLSGTSWAALGSVKDLVVPAVEGDTIGCWVSGVWGTEANYGALDMRTMVASSPVNGISGQDGASDWGVGAWRGRTGAETQPGGLVTYTLLAGDVEGGNVTLRMYYRTNAASPAKVLFGGGGGNLSFAHGVINFGQV